MKRSFWEMRIPTVFGLVLLLGGVMATAFVVQKNTNLRSKAAADATPENVRITNITDTSFTVSYETTASVLGTVAYGPTSSYGNTALDERDTTSNTPQEHKLHYITVHNLTALTAYHFSILSSNQTFLDNGQPFSVTTGKSITQTPSAPAVTGKVSLPDGMNPQDVVVYVTSEKTQTLSTLLDADGSFKLDFSWLHAVDLSSPTLVTATDSFAMLVQGSNTVSHILFLAGNANPLPLITLSKDYDFTATTSLSETTASSSALAGIPRTPDPTASASPAILSPKKSEGLHDTQPVFNGTAAPGAEVIIVIHSATTIQSTVKADPAGTWSYRPTTALAPGNHTITITTKDLSGVLKTITQSFTVYAQGSQFVEPSVSPSTPTSTPTIVLTPTVAVSPTVLPTLAISPTLEVTPIASATPTIIILSPTPTIFTPAPTLPATGSSATIAAGIIGFLTMVFGITIFVFTGGKL